MCRTDAGAGEDAAFVDQHTTADRAVIVAGSIDGDSPGGPAGANHINGGVRPVGPALGPFDNLTEFRDELLAGQLAVGDVLKLAPAKGEQRLAREQQRKDGLPWRRAQSTSAATHSGGSHSATTRCRASSIFSTMTCPTMGGDLDVHPIRRIPRKRLTVDVLKIARMRDKQVGGDGGWAGRGRNGVRHRLPPHNQRRPILPIMTNTLRRQPSPFIYMRHTDDRCRSLFCGRGVTVVSDPHPCRRGSLRGVAHDQFGREGHRGGLVAARLAVPDHLDADPGQRLADGGQRGCGGDAGSSKPQQPHPRAPLPPPQRGERTGGHQVEATSGVGSGTRAAAPGDRPGHDVVPGRRAGRRATSTSW
jgi:hypothetical protein